MADDWIQKWRAEARAPFERLLEEAMRRKRTNRDMLWQLVLELERELNIFDVVDFVSWFFVRWTGLPVGEYGALPLIGLNDHRFTQDERRCAETFLEKRLCVLFP